MNLQRFRVIVACGMLLLAGCGNSQTGTVSGRVTHKGQVVNSGQVAFTPADGVPRNAVIAADGRYSVSGVPVGRALITVIRPDPAQPEGNPEALPLPGVKRPPGWFELPARYGDRSRSGLELDVQSGPQEYDLKLE